MVAYRTAHLLVWMEGSMNAPMRMVSLADENISAKRPQKNMILPISETLLLAARHHIRRPTIATNNGTSAMNIPGA